MTSMQDSYEKLINSLKEYQTVIQENIRQLQPAQVAPEKIDNDGQTEELSESNQ